MGFPYLREKDGRTCDAQLGYVRGLQVAHVWFYNTREWSLAMLLTVIIWVCICSPVPSRKVFQNKFGLSCT